MGEKKNIDNEQRLKHLNVDVLIDGCWQMDTGNPDRNFQKMKHSLHGHE